MDAVIPAAGRGSRLGELTDDRPKGLIDVAGRALLAHVFENRRSRRGPTGWSSSSGARRGGSSIDLATLSANRANIVSPFGRARIQLLVTGGAGFIGSRLAESFLADGHDVTVLDNFEPLYAEGINAVAGV